MMGSEKKDLLWILIVSVLILAGSSLPTWAGYQAETAELRFRGMYSDSQDYAVHIAMMESGRQGEWAYQFRFTTEPHKPAYIRMFYIFLGHISQWLGLPSELTYQLARWSLGLAALFAMYGLMLRIFPERFWARTGFLLAALGSGLGWLQAINQWTSTAITPIDFWLIDAYVFFSLSIFPHFAFVTAAMCVALYLWLGFLDKPNWWNVAGVGLFAFLVQWVNPIAFATVNAALFGAMLFKWWKTNKYYTQDLAALIVIAIVQIPLLVYNFIVLTRDPLWSQFNLQNQTLSPPPDYYLWGFALFWPFVIVGVLDALRTKSPAAGAAIFWIISGFLLAYAPVDIQRRFLQNITIPLAVLATMGLSRLFELAENKQLGISRWRASLVIVVIFLASLSSIQIGLSQMAYVQTHPEQLFYPAALDPAIDWLRQNAEPGDFVLASERTSQVLAQKAGLRVYSGHEMETIQYKKKQAEVQAFFKGTRPGLAARPIRWVIYGPDERGINYNFKATDNLELIFEASEYTIYRVKE